MFMWSTMETTGLRSLILKETSLLNGVAREVIQDSSFVPPLLYPTPEVIYMLLTA